MEAQAASPPTPFPWRRVLVVGLIALALAVLGAGVGAFVWLKTYAPLAPGPIYGGDPTDGHEVEPVVGSGGIPVLFLRDDGGFRVNISLRNRGRFDLRVLPPRPAPGGFVPVAFRATHWSVAGPLRAGAYVGAITATRPLVLRPGEQRLVEVRYRTGFRCVGGQRRQYWQGPGSSMATGNPHIGIRIRYARFFERMQEVPLPFAYALMCVRGARATSS